MKKVIYIITTILLCMTSCTDIHDTYSEYIKDGEQIYVGKLADVKIHPGFQRMMITGSMKYLATAKTCIIELVGYDKVFTTDIDRTQPEFSYEIRLGYRQETDMNLRKTTAKSNMMMRMGMSMNFRYL